MNQIRPWLYIGKYRETKHLALLNAHGIDAMLQMAELVEQPNITTLYLNIDDGKALPIEKLAQGIEFILERHKAGNRVFVSCGAGVSRSASLVIAALKEAEGVRLFDAYKDVKRCHPEALPHPALWQSLCDFYNENTPYLELMRFNA